MPRCRRALPRCGRPHRAGTPAVTLPPLRLPYGRVLVPLRQFSTDIEFDIDLTPGCEGTINGVMERYFEVPRGVLR